MSEPLIFPALCAVMSDVDAVPKDRTGEGVRYKYQGVADILAKAQPSFAKHGVVMVPHSVRHHAQQDRETRNGGLQVQADLLVQWRFYAADGSFVEAETYGHAFDTSDKAFNKAMTASQKYALKQVLAIPEDADDQDAERPDTGQRIARAPQKPREPMAQPERTKVAADLNARILALPQAMQTEFWAWAQQQDGMGDDNPNAWPKSRQVRAGHWIDEAQKSAEPFGEPEVDRQTGEIVEAVS